jgi:hypothetical protein
MPIEIKEFRPYVKNTLQGFCTVLLQPSGLEIRDLTVHQKGDRRWINMPSRPYQNSEGKTSYSFIILFPDKERSQQFQTAVLKALDKYLPPPPKQTESERYDDGSIPF